MEPTLPPDPSVETDYGPKITVKNAAPCAV